uniref:Target of myb1 membrane trafficking protein n=1 Tax=Paramormyrops kingsleyae TaxID=1676925 RepID=A0A3B3SEW7_9TELE|nr:target of Myb protein 1-like isoform X1 [Paramormyrops kingsleyae]
MDFLIGNPFSTPVGQRIERATSSSLPTEDWALNMEICDIVNETDEGPKEAVRAIKKRIVGNKNFREVMFALTVLETCVKNCGHRFHVLVSNREFVEGVLVQAILPKNNPPMILHDRVLSLIQAWADAFRSSPSLMGVVSVYEDLKRRGLEFPMTDLDALSPIHTPHRSVPENESSTTPPSGSSDTRPPQNPPLAQNTGPSITTPEQETVRKLRADLEVVRGNQKVMSEMLSQLTPSSAQQSDVELLQQLYTVCRDMQSRVLELIPRLADEGLIGELLAVNDDLNNTFLSYHRFERLSSSPHAAERRSDTVSTDLIDLSLAPPTSLANQPSSQSDATASPKQTATHSTEVEDEFDMFAQTRNSSLAEQRKCVRYEDPGAVEGLAGALDSRLHVTGAIPTPQTAVMEDIEKWLSEDVKDDTGETEGVTSEEFDKFLEDRAKVADHLPTVRNTTPALTRPQSQPSRSDETAHDQLFTL